MRRLFRSLVLVSLSLGLASASGCKRTQASADTSPGSTGAEDTAPAAKPKRVRRKPGLPRPLRLPASAPIVVHVQSPAAALSGLRRYWTEMPEDRVVLERAVAQLPGAGALESQLASAVDLARPWDIASVDGELIVHLPIRSDQIATVESMLADKPPVGRFGGVSLQRGDAPGPALGWLDRDAGTLTLASTERGLATGRHLERQYGKEHPLRVELDGAEARTYAPRFALERLDLRGPGTHAFDLEARGVPPEVLAPLGRLQDGALSGLLQSPPIAAGVTSKYADYDRDVRTILGDLKRQVDRQNFLVRPPLQDLLRRLGAVMRSWNGRTMVGVGPARHVRLGVGAEDPKKMGGALFHLMNGVVDNLDLARTLGVSVPRIRVQRNKAIGAGHNVSVIVLSSARRYLPPEAAELLDERGDLNVAVAFSPRNGAGMVVVGPDSAAVLAGWLEDVAEATPAADSLRDLVAATVAIDPSELEPLLRGGDPAALLGLNAADTPTTMTVTRDGDVVKASVRGPKPRVRRIRGLRASRSTPSSARSTPSSSGPKPARRSRPTHKPIP